MSGDNEKSDCLIDYVDVVKASEEIVNVNQIAKEIVSEIVTKCTEQSLSTVESTDNGNAITISISNDRAVENIDHNNISNCFSNLETSDEINSLDSNVVSQFTPDIVSETEQIKNGNPTNSITTPDIATEGTIVQNVSTDLRKHLATSSMSLNEHQNIDKHSTIIQKKPVSRSAENISLKDTLTLTNRSIENELDKENALTEFSKQKTKVSATQKVVNECQPIDVRNIKTNNHIIPQDLGSIVKNVHGIFSSVSGSLKTAYSISQKASTQFKYPKIENKPVENKNSGKHFVNGKIINDIFEEDVANDNESKEHCKTVNGFEHNLNTEKPSSTTEKSSPPLDDDIKKDVMKLRVESLESVLAEERKEMESLRERVRQQSEELRSKDHTFKELEGKMDMMCKRVEQAEREKDAAVMRYANGECATIEARRASETSQKAEKAAQAEVELLNNKLKSAHSEKQRICQLYDNKCHELTNSERELTKAREDWKELEGRLKWTQSKLRLEMDVNKECLERAERLSQQVAELEAAKEAALTNATETLRAKQFESELKESRASLILCRHEREELERRLTAATQHLEHCQKELQENTRELVEHRKKVEELTASNMRLEEEAASLASLSAQASLADSLTVQLERELARTAQAEAEAKRAGAQAEASARREAEALRHAAALTAEHVHAAAHLRRHADKAQALTADNVSLREKVESLEAEVSRLEKALSVETDTRHKENRILARKVAELTEESEEANKKLEWEKGENEVLKKKHASAIKELNRELHRMIKRCEQLEAKIPHSEPETSTRTGSVSSISSGEGLVPNAVSNEDHLQNGHSSDTIPDIQIKDPSLLNKIFSQTWERVSRQALVERVVALQRAAARRAERVEFLEEHARALTAELRRRATLLRHVLPALPAAALAGAARDQHKKEIADRGGGAMAALWGGDTSGLTLELSVQMNKQLQAVLEDALLKNITLKENMDTLGEEIARLKAQSTSNSISKDK